MAAESMKSFFKGIESGIEDDIMDHTFDKKLVVNVAPTGAFVYRKENPHQPISPKEIAQAVIDSCKAGATMWHVHIRDEEGYPSSDPDLFIRTTDMIMAECPGIITSLNVLADTTKKGVGQIKPLAEPLAKAGLKYIRTAVVPPCARKRGPMTKPMLQEIIAYLQDIGIRPEFQIHHYEALMNVVNWLIKPGILKEPPIMNIILGHHGWSFSAPTTPTHWGMTYYITMKNLLPADSIIGTTAGGHNWLPMTIVGILLGTDCVRVGMDDTLWMYPNSDEKITNCADVVKKVATITRELGREVATAEEAKGILGLKD
jgi:3-keto-5-aminohexanoate cleavage enzyme